MNAFKTLIFVAFIFLVATFQSCTELRLSLFGERAEGAVTNVMMEINAKTREPTGKYLVYYAFKAKENGAISEFKGEYTVSREEAEAASKGDTVRVIHDASRPLTHSVVGHRRTGWIIVFFIFLVIFAINGWMVWQQARQDVERSRRR